MTVEEIKKAIPRLSLEERVEVTRCLHGWEEDDWDRQMKADLADGKLNKLISKVESDIAVGKSMNLP